MLLQDGLETWDDALPTAAPKTVSAGPMGLLDVGQAFRLVLEGSRHGHFSNLYLKPRYRAGLGLQLFGLLRGRLRMPGGQSFRAHARVLRLDGAFAGLVVLREVGTAEWEIYVCAIDAAARGRGLGEKLVGQALARHCSPGDVVYADCLPASDKMKRMLLRMGFAASLAPEPCTPGLVRLAASLRQP